MLAGAGAAVAASAVGAGPALAHAGGRGGGRGRIPRDRISIQLYTLRDLLAEDLDGTLRALARIGYRRVEHAGFHGRTAAQFRAALDRAGLRATSGHQGIPQPFDATAWQGQISDALTIGQQYIVNPASPILFFPPDGDLSKLRSLGTAAAWRAYAADLNRAGAMARAAGLRFGYHNHFWEFTQALEDDTPLVGYDILIADTDPRLVHFELDLYWAWFAHRDPVQLLAHVGDRIRQFHVKDMRFVNHAPTFTDPGTGVIDFARIFGAAGDPRRHEYIVERDDAGAAALTTAAVGFEFLSSVRF